MIKKQALPSLEEALSGTLFGDVKRDEKQIVMLDPAELTEIDDQPFHPYPPEKLEELAEDIKENGQISPCLVRKKDGQKIILAGRNRKKACELAGVKVSCILIECDDATANLILVNSNLNQRQELLPSEKAFAYKLQKESYEAKGQRKTAAAVAESSGNLRKKLNVKTIQRYIKLTDLTRSLLDLVDSGQVPVTAGVELSDLSTADMNCISSYLVTHPDIILNGNQAEIIHSWSPNITYLMLQNLFFPKGQGPEAAKRQVKAKEQGPKPVISITIKISDLEGLNSNFDFETASKAEIKDFILDSLENYFDHLK